MLDKEILEVVPLPHDDLGGHGGADGDLEQRAVGARASLELRGVEELAGLDVVQEGGLSEDAAAA